MEEERGRGWLDVNKEGKSLKIKDSRKKKTFFNFVHRDSNG
jgi:hypothetical protein